MEAANGERAKAKYIVKRIRLPFGGLEWGVYERFSHGDMLRATAGSEELAERIADMLNGE